MYGLACWGYGDPGHFQYQCPVMENEALVRLPDVPQAAPDRVGMYRILVSVQGVHTKHWWIQAVIKQ